jgi:hypothetical protein
MADANLFDLGVGVPGAGEGIIDLIELLKLPEIYQSYKDQDAMMPVRDALRFIPNVVSDVATFTGDILSDIPAAVVDKAAATEFYNPFSEEGQARNLERSKGFLPYIPGVDFQMNPLSDRGADFASSLISNLTGLPSISRDNPMVDSSLSQELIQDTASTIKLQEQQDLMALDADGDGFADVGAEYAFDNTPSFRTFALNNPDKTADDYNNLLTQKYNEKMEEILPSSKYDEAYADLLSKNSMAKFGYDMFDQDFEMSELLGPGARKFNIGNFGIINQPAKYVGEGEYFLPFMEYESPEKEALENLTFVGDLAYGIPGLVRSLSRTGAKQTPELDEAMKEYMRD